MDLVSIVQKAFEAKKTRYTELLDGLQTQHHLGVVGNAVYGLAGVPLHGESDPLFKLYDSLPWEEHLVVLLARDGARLALDRTPDTPPGITSFIVTEVSVTGAECKVTLEDGLLSALDDGKTPALAEDQVIELMLGWAAMHVPDEKMAGFTDHVSSLEGMIAETRAAELEEPGETAPAPHPPAPPPAPR